MEQARALPLIAIMMPVFNGEKTLPLAVASLVSQSYSNWKCIIVNDGSTDGTKTYLDSLSGSKFVVIHFEHNRGRSLARQAALDVAEGEYLAFLDADDFYHPEKLKKQVELLEANPEVDLISCGNASYDSNFNLIRVRGCGNGQPKKYKEGGRLRAALRNSMFRMEVAKKNSFNTTLKFAQDTDFLFKILSGRNYLEMDEVLYYYSEFVSVDKGKILISYYYGIKSVPPRFLKSPIFGMREIFTNFAKILFVLILWPFLKGEFFLNRRGRPPSDQEVADFRKTLAFLKNVNMLDVKAP